MNVVTREKLQSLIKRLKVNLINGFAYSPLTKPQYDIITTFLIAAGPSSNLTQGAALTSMTVVNFSDYTTEQAALVDLCWYHPELWNLLPDKIENFGAIDRKTTIRS